MRKSSVNVAVVGWGNFFKHIHEQTLVDLIGAGRCRLRAVCVRNAETRAAIIQERGADYGTGDYREVLADPQVDAVLIGAPHSVQAEVALAAIAAGKWVYVEKPLFADESETGVAPGEYFRQFMAQGEPALQRLAVGLNKRFAPAHLEIRRRTAQWGGLKTIVMSVVDDAWRWGGKYPPGFLMWLDVCHWIDLGRWFTDAEVAGISCLSPQVEDSLLTMRMSNGAAVTIVLSGNATMDRFKEQFDATTGTHTTVGVTDYVQMEVFGGPQRELHRYPANLQTHGDVKYLAAIEAGGLEAFRSIRRELYDRYLRLQTHPDPVEEAYLKRNLPNFMRPQGWKESLAAFVDSVAARRPLTNSATYRDAYRAYLVLEATKLSVASGGAFVQASTPPSR